MSEDVVIHQSKPRLPPEIEPGAIVWLRSGSVRLTVARIETREPSEDGRKEEVVVHVVWSKDGVIHRDAFADYTLTTVRPS